jgi:hypothetical protein
MTIQKRNPKGAFESFRPADMSSIGRSADRSRSIMGDLS